MDNKTFKRVVALVATVMMLCSCAFATTISNVNYADGVVSLNYEAGTGADKVLLLVKTNDANGAIIAANQDDDEAIDGAFSEKIDTTKLTDNVNALYVEVGDNGEGNSDTAIINFYTLTLVYNNGADNTTVKKVGGTPIADLCGEAPEKDADNYNTYAFDKWYTDAELSSPLEDGAKLENNTTLYAGYTATPITYNITYAGEVIATANAGTDIATLLAEKTASKAEDKYNTYAFEGWYLDAEFNTAAAGELLANTEVFANFTSTARKYTVKIGDAEAVDYEYNATVELTTETEYDLEGYRYTFDKWVVNGIDYSEEANTTVTVTGNLVIEAVYTSEKIKVYYTITLKVDGNEYKVIENVEEGTMISAAIADVDDPEKKDTDEVDYTFVAWNYNDAAIAGDVIIEATFDKAVKAPTKSVSTEIVRNGKTYTDAPNATVQATYNGVDSGKVYIRYYDGTKYDTNEKAFSLSDNGIKLDITGNNATMTFDVVVLGVPEGITVTDITAEFNN